MHQKVRMKGCDIILRWNTQSLETLRRAATVSLTTLRKDLRVDSVIARN